MEAFRIGVEAAKIGLLILVVVLLATIAYILYTQANYLGVWPGPEPVLESAPPPEPEPGRTCAEIYGPDSEFCLD